MNFKTELRIFEESPKPKNFEEYIGNQVAHGCDINLMIKEVFKVVEKLRETIVELEVELNSVPNHEEEISEKLKIYEEELRKKYSEADSSKKNELNAQIRIVNKLIDKFLAEADNNQTEEPENIEGV